MQTWWRVLSSAPWRRAPVLLWRRPGVLVAVAGAVTVVAAALAAVPLFLSSVGTATVDLQAAERCPRDTGVTLQTTEWVRPYDDPDPFAPVADRFGPTNRWARVDRVRLAPAGGAGQAVPASLLTREEALDHIEVIEGTNAPGVLIPDRAAEKTGLRPGDEATIDGAHVRIAGVYRDLAGTSVDDFWCSNGNLLLLRVLAGDLVLPPPMVIADRQTFRELTRGVDLGPLVRAFEAPLRPGLTVSGVEDLIQELGCGTPVEPPLEWCQGGRRPPIDYTGSRGGVPRPVLAGDEAEFVERFLRSSLPFVARRARAVQTSVGGGIWPMAGFGALAGIGLVAAAASLWFDRRRREVTLLATRGVSPAALGLKAVLELLAALVAGAAAGIGLADVGVRWLGPSSVIEPTALWGAARAGLGALVVAAATIGVVVTWRASAHETRRSRRRWVGALPWEVLLAAGTVTSYRHLGDWGVPVGRGADLSRVDVVGLVFPVLFLVTSVAVLGRVLGLAVRPLRALSRSWPMALYLGVRRIARHRAAVVGLVAASALSAGVFGYATTLNRSLDETLDVKADTFVGSDLAVQIAAGEAVPAALADRSTSVTVHRDAYVNVGRRESVIILILEDPVTFERSASWDRTFADRSLSAVLDELVQPTADRSVPAAVVGLEVDGPTDVRIVGSGSPRFSVRDIGGVHAFPGMSRPDPTIVVSRQALDALGVTLPAGSPEVWIRGDRQASLRELSGSVAGFEEVRSAAEVVDSASFTTVSWTFGFMQSLGLSAGLLALGGAAVYLDARRRERILGYAFMRRMGLTRSGHRRALGAELVAGILVGAWSGLGLALVAAWLAHDRIDPVPGFRPAPILRPAFDVLTVFLVLSVVVTAAAAVLAQRRVDRDDPVEVLRAGV